MIWLTWLYLGIHAVLTVVACVHALLFKRDPRAAFGWIGISLFVPVVGPLVYFVFGVNRIQTRAKQLTGRRRSFFNIGFERGEPGGAPTVPGAEVPSSLAPLVRLTDAVSVRPLVPGNRIELLHNGEEVFPAMLEAIAGARKYLYLTTYIFETNRTGLEFRDALVAAHRRGVAVKVLIDGFGELYSRGKMSTLLRKAGVPTAQYLPPRLVPPTLRVNLRNHRKILVADGEVAFVGGMNIGDRHLAADRSNPDRVVDAHCRLWGPVVAQLEQVFLEDWSFVTKAKAPPLPEVVVPQSPPGEALCRTVIDGPNEDMDRLVTVLLGAISAARHRIAVMTPYFVPPRELVAALQAAALRGVDVCVILPENNNLAYVAWATTNLLWEPLLRGVEVRYRPGPFAHTKLFAVDDVYCQIGSANLDTRSLRLNFELNVEVYDQHFARQVLDHFDGIRAVSRRVTLEEVDDRSLLVRLRDSLAWLFSPYL